MGHCVSLFTLSVEMRFYADPKMSNQQEQNMIGLCGFHWIPEAICGK